MAVPVTGRLPRPCRPTFVVIRQCWPTNKPFTLTLSLMKPHSDNWIRIQEDGITQYRYRWDSAGEAAVWKQDGRWQLSYTLDAGSPEFSADLGRAFSPSTALERAEMVMADARRQVDQSYYDMQTVLNLANEIEDRAPHEQAAIDRMTEALQQHPMFEQDRLDQELPSQSLDWASDRSQNQSQNRGRGR
jgi:hypothetical protein